MSTANRILPFILIAVFTALTGTCGDQATGPGETLAENSMLVSGALNAGLEFPTVVANSRSHDDLRIMQILVKSETTRDGQNEQAQLMVVFPFQSEGSLPDEGSYTFEDGEILVTGFFNGSLNYRLRDDPCCEDQCSFGCTSMDLYIDSSEGNRMRGKFSIAGDQTSGMRIRNGLVEDLILGMDGEIMISAKFDIEVLVD